MNNEKQTVKDRRIAKLEGVVEQLKRTLCESYYNNCELREKLDLATDSSQPPAARPSPILLVKPKIADALRVAVPWITVEAISEYPDGIVVIECDTDTAGHLQAIADFDELIAAWAAYKEGVQR